MDTKTQPMSKNIIIRDLTEDQQQKLEILRMKFGEATNSKTILVLLDKFMELEITETAATDRYNKIKRESRELKEFCNSIMNVVTEFKEAEEEEARYYN